ncbi:MAG: hypothetical protein JXR48_13570 [Candidatus Delongbacteria bacterium]|nr:hypothetical protein [Candidatus Delongbacteria bacterium]MBN2835985.1 hypothetical protein [Candidatus Delongbacteria bacterium]
MKKNIIILIVLFFFTYHVHSNSTDYKIEINDSKDDDKVIVSNDRAYIVVENGTFFTVDGDYKSFGYGAVNIFENAVFSLTGDFISQNNSANPIHYNSRGKTLFNGLSIQTLSGVYSITFNKLELNNPFGICLNIPIRIENSLFLNDSKIRTGSNSVYFAEGVDVLRDNGYITIEDGGSVLKDYNSSGIFTFPINTIADGDNITPITLNFSSGVFNKSSVEVSLKSEKFSLSSASSSINRYWSIKMNGISGYECSFNCSYLDSDLNGAENHMYNSFYAVDTLETINQVNINNNLLNFNSSNFGNNFILTGSFGNKSPEIASSPETIALIGTEYLYDIAIQDIDGDNIETTNATIPSWMVYDNTTKKLSGTPQVSDIGDYEINLTFSDGFAQIHHIFNIEVIGGSQTISLEKGWNLISSYINPIQSNIDQIFSEINNSVILVKDELGNIYSPLLKNRSQMQWDFDDCFFVKTTESVNLTLQGNIINPEVEIIDLEIGWNFLPYYKNTSITVDEVLSDILNNIYAVKSIEGYLNVPLWNYHSLNEMQPGKGYKILIKNPCSFHYSGNKFLLKKGTN